MNRERLLLAVASVLAGTTVLMVAMGVTYNLAFVLMAVPFAIAASILWADVTGRLHRGKPWRVRRETRRAPHDGRQRRTRARVGDRTSPDSSPRREEARRILGVGKDADRAEIRRVYRERVKEVHPDREEGSEEEFKRVTEAYERLS